MSGSRARTAAFAVAVLVHLVVLYWPRAPGVASGLPVDKVVHLLVFAAVAWTGVRAGLAWQGVLAALLAHAVLSEAVQQAVLPGRSGDPVDALADALGAVSGVWLARRHADGTAEDTMAS